MFPIREVLVQTISLDHLISYSLEWSANKMHYSSSILALQSLLRK